MGINKSLYLLFAILLLFSTLCHANDKIVLEAVGHGECVDCARTNVKSSRAFSGLHVTIECEAPNEKELKTRGEGKLDNEGKFIVSLPHEILENGKLKQNCFAQLHSASNTPCPTHNNGLEPSKLVFETMSNGKHIFTTAQKLKFSPSTCTSAFLWPFFKHPTLPKFSFPLPMPFFKKPCPTLAPFFRKPLPPPVPIYKPKPNPTPPVYVKPLPPPVPVYKPKPKPKPPVYKPKPEPPVYKPKPKPPVYKPKPKPPVYKPKPKPPVYKPPPYVKPLPTPVPSYEKPLPPPVPIYKPISKPLPPFPTIPKKPPCPPLPKLPTYPKIPPKYFHHPIFAPWTPHSP